MLEYCAKVPQAQIYLDSLAAANVGDTCLADTDSHVAVTVADVER
jgi:hypothetical protein